MSADTGDVVLVTWTDAYYDFELPVDGALRDEYPVRTVGFIVRLDDRFVSLAAEELPDDDGWRAVTHIPTELIQDWKML